MEHDFQIRLLFGTAAIFAAYEAMKADRWQRIAFWVVTGSFASVALGWTWLQGIYAPATAFIVSIATNNETWLLLFALVMVAIAVSSRQQPKKDDTDDADDDAFDEELLIPRGPPPISTPQLAEDLRAAIARLDERLGKRIDKAVTSAEIVEFMEEIKTKADWSEQKSAETGERLDHLNRHFNAVNLDLLHILDFVIDQATVEFLNHLISEAPRIVEPIASHDDESVRKSTYEAASHFIQTVTAQLGGSFRGEQFRTVMEFASAEAERALPPTGWPVHVKFVDYRLYAIVEMQCTRALAFLSHQRDEVVARVSQARGNLIGRKQDREQAMKAGSAS